MTAERRPPDGESLRRRRAVALSGFGNDESTARPGLADSSPRVRCAALAALARGGNLAAADLLGALGDPSPEVRAGAAELAAGRGDIDLSGVLGDSDARVVEAAAWACGEHPAADSGVVSQLGEIATSHPDALCRETAVAALGAIGDGAGLAAVLAATGDRATVRRRAVLALAAFSGPEVEEALERAAGDRDWQVRQAAEDLRQPIFVGSAEGLRRFSPRRRSPRTSPA
ncbi:MAG: HEAT repeat domain-containing protein [bacterium]|nr:HEAT repeat domain-containing protein [bacterium]